MHEFAFVFYYKFIHLVSVLMGPYAFYASASKVSHEAGRRGGESTARQRTFAHLFSQPARVTAPRGFAMMSVGDAGAFEGVAGF
ncbi:MULTISPECIES: hypothetical protein [Klebsiella pneumoniae complex]|uniref:hypothetical protein n=1 Tax=Klebsiella quasipneumoniae TaxID=1463165 RepID=UPI0010359F9A|nr:hypothetical protein [Klebsiella quasipneumoniae]TBP38675.1 hypothetical protein EXU05_20585 [Klebsiella quasipneumoniae subsp. quasipneumoniae]TBP64814.1 hypothetical protein EXT99_22560 [Klebsiella quasipneumoniae subsp. quasipneumoniae]TBP99601.1 hypothetical protein EXU07_23050 [Klebsiella quasipneumoniae subsp. quasipneumoniae]TBQ64057.1 hypothetical protein EXU11_22135 [Klebsiella quasipneumoniae subsp. quasipneumoniae]